MDHFVDTFNAIWYRTCGPSVSTGRNFTKGQHTPLIRGRGPGLETMLSDATGFRQSDFRFSFLSRNPRWHRRLCCIVQRTGNKQDHCILIWFWARLWTLILLRIRFEME